MARRASGRDDWAPPRALAISFDDGTGFDWLDQPRYVCGRDWRKPGELEALLRDA